MTQSAACHSAQCLAGDPASPAKNGIQNRVWTTFLQGITGSTMGRFMSPDPMGGHLEDPQTLNRYAYARNNPTSLTDPMGLDSYLSCAQTKDNASTCQQQQVGTDKNGNAQMAAVQGTSDKNGNFTATQIGNDANGNLVRYRNFRAIWGKARKNCKYLDRNSLFAHSLTLRTYVK
jgi:hypothetical protein